MWNLSQVRREKLDRYLALEARITRASDLAHATGADPRNDLVGAKSLSRFRFQVVALSPKTRMCATAVRARG